MIIVHFLCVQVAEPYCSLQRDDCGNNAIAIILFISYYIIVTFILINVFVGERLHVFVLTKKTC